MYIPLVCVCVCVHGLTAGSDQSLLVGRRGRLRKGACKKRT